MKTLETWHIVDRGPSWVALQVDGAHTLRIEALELAQFRVRLLKNGAWRLDRSWTVAPEGPLPPEGRSRDSLAGFSCPPLKTDTQPDRLVLSTGQMRAVVRHPLQICWQALHGGIWHDVAQDRPTGAYMLGRRTHAVAHFLRRHAGEQVFGLGEKAGLLERGGRRFEMH